MTEHPYIAPEPDGLHRAMADARHRRYRSAGLSSTTLAAVGVMVCALMGTSATQSLIQQPAPQQPAITTLIPAPHGGGTARENVVRTTTRSGGATGSAAALSAPGTTTLGGGRAGVTAPAAARRVPTTAPMVRTQTTGPTSIDSCPIDRTGAGQTAVCPSGGAAQHYDAANNPVPGVQDLRMDVCSYSTRTVDLHFATTLEVDMVVLDSAGHEVWRWSLEHPPVVDPHQSSVGTGDCLTWTTTWRQVDERGRALPSGSYTLRVVGFVKELGSANVADAPLTIS